MWETVNKCYDYMNEKKNLLLGTPIQNYAHKGIDATACILHVVSSTNEPKPNAHVYMRFMYVGLSIHWCCQWVSLSVGLHFFSVCLRLMDNFFLCHIWNRICASGRKLSRLALWFCFSVSHITNSTIRIHDFTVKMTTIYIYIYGQMQIYILLVHASIIQTDTHRHTLTHT